MKPVEIIDGKRECLLCRGWKPLADFPASSKTLSGTASRCKECISERRKSKVPPQPCACGCGALAEMGSRYVPGHAHKGKKRPEWWTRKMSNGLKRAWSSGKFEGKQRPNYDVIAAKNRGKKRNADAVEATRRAVKEAWARGDYDAPETVAKRNAHLARLHREFPQGRTPEQMDEIRAKRDLDALRPKWRENMLKRREQWAKDGTAERANDTNRKRLKGGHGFGRGTSGRLDHTNAKHWIVRDPCGRVYSFDNLREWVRRNIRLFKDHRPESRLPFWYRVSSGIKNLGNKNGKATSYYGWVLVSATELEDGARDLLGRDEAKMKGVLA